MRKSQILGLALFAVFAFSAITAAAAFAESEWLLNGAPITTAVEVLSEGELLLCDDNSPLGKACVHCSGLNKGLVGPGKTDVTEEVTGLAGEKDITNCTNDENCPTPILVEADNLPWPTEIFLVGTEFRDLIGAAGKQPGYLVSCAGGFFTDLCEGHATVRLTNEVGGVLAHFENLEVATCTLGGASQGLVEGTSLIFDHVGELSVS